MKVALKSIAVPEFVEQFSRRILGTSRGRELNRFQWSALRFFSCARKKARTIQEFAATHSMSRRRAAQIVAQLKRRRLLKSRKPQLPVQPELIDLTAAGAELLRRDPQQSVRAALAHLSARERRALARALKRASDALAAAGKGTKRILLFVATGAWSYGSSKESHANHGVALDVCDVLSRLA